MRCRTGVLTFAFLEASNTTATHGPSRGLPLCVQQRSCDFVCRIMTPVGWCWRPEQNVRGSYRVPVQLPGELPEGYAPCESDSSRAYKSACLQPRRYFRCKECCLHATIATACQCLSLLHPLCPSHFVPTLCFLLGVPTKPGPFS